MSLKGVDGLKDPEDTAHWKLRLYSDLPTCTPTLFMFLPKLRLGHIYYLELGLSIFPERGRRPLLCNRISFSA